MHGTSEVTLPRPSTHSQSEKSHKNDSIKGDSRFSRYEESRRDDKSDKHHLSKFLYTERQSQTQSPRPKSLERRYNDVEKNGNLDKRRNERYHEEDDFDEWQQNPRHLREKYIENSRNSKQRQERQERQEYDEDVRYRGHSKYEKHDEDRYRYNDYEDELREYKEPPVPKARQKYALEEKFYSENSRYKENGRYYKDGAKSMERSKQKHISDESRYYTNEKKGSRSESGLERYSIHSDSMQPSEKSSRSKYSHDDYLIESDPRKRPELRQRSPSPVENVSPRDRFKDAKEKFLLLERERLEEQERLRKEAPISPTRKERHFMKRHESMAYSNPKDRFERYEKYDGRDNGKERYYDENRYEADEHIRPEPAPRTMIHENVRYRKDAPVDRYRNSEKYEPKRRSMFSLIEEEHRKNSNEIAKELKRRSYMENNGYGDEFYRDRDRSFTELPESERYSTLERDGYHYSKSSVELDKVGEMKYDQKFLKNQKVKNAAGYRHSYAEPKLKMEKSGKKHFPDMLHRTNSSVSNSGRVGIASVHPY